MNRIALFIGSVFLVGGAYFALRDNPTVNSPMPVQSADQPSQSIDRQVAPAVGKNRVGYCIALRGNGEAEPAHWGALARTVEQLGLPDAMSGGSSATISMFLMEAIASHPLIINESLPVQKERASLLLKSLLGFAAELKQSKTWQSVQGILEQYNSVKSKTTFEQIMALYSAGKTTEALQSVQRAVDLGLLDPQSAAPLLKNAFSPKKASLYMQQLMETAKVFGKFDAANDNNLFFRPGIISFEKASETFGKIAAFYSVFSRDPKQLEKWQDFFDFCAGDSKNSTWREIAGKKPACAAKFHDLFASENWDPITKENPANWTISNQIQMYPTTSVLVDQAAQDFKKALAQYQESLDPQFGSKFKIQNPEHVRFGYWGLPDSLKTIASRLDPQDEKSRRFLPLGLATWKKVISLSPAEPGLAPLKPFEVEGQSYVSAGGWSDLHPVTVLKASGCDQVVYITRTGGESLFAQGVAKRLLNLDRDWSLLDKQNDKAKELNKTGDKSDLSSLWSRLFNLGNPASSISKSLSAASAILCTNWDAYPTTFEGLVPLIEDSYKSSYFVSRDARGEVGRLSPTLTSKKPGCAP